MHMESCHDADEHPDVRIIDCSNTHITDAEKHTVVLTSNCSNIHSKDADEHAEVLASNRSGIHSKDADDHFEVLTMSAQKAASSLNSAGLSLIMEALLFRVGWIDA